METVEKKNVGSATLRAFVIGVLLSGLFAWITVLLDNVNVVDRHSRNISANLIPALPHVMLIIVGLLINPLLRRVKIARLFSKAELLLIFVMTAVSSGVATWGLSGTLIPVVSGVSNKTWNTDQSQWDANVMPFLNENYFIAGEGTRAAAVDLREVYLAHQEARAVYQRARDLLLGRQELARIQAYLEEIALTADPEERQARERAMFWPNAQAVKLVDRTTEEWTRIGKGMEPQVVADTYGPKIAELRKEMAARRQVLKDLNNEAFEEVELIRKGLPRDKRAIPGFFYSGGEGFASYSARIRRYRIGGASREKLRSAEAVLAKVIADSSTLPADWPEQILDAAGMLQEISDIPVLSRLNDELSAKLAGLENQIAEQENEAGRLRHLRRYSQQNQFQAFNSKIDEVDKSVASSKKEAEALRSRLEIQIRPLLEVRELVKTTRADLLELAEDAKAVTAEQYPELRERLQEEISAYPSFDASTRRFWLGDAKWKIWLKPVFNWLVVIFISYIVFMAFNNLIFRQWAHNEKLIYPLAEVATVLAEGCGAESKGKTLLRSGLFWTGFAISAGILGWNHLATNDIIPNINPVKLESLWHNYVGGGFFKGLGSTYFCIIFAVIGVSFLVPSKISFSLWFFEVLYMGLLLVMVWLGYGANRWDLGSVGRSGLGAGSMLVFGGTILWTCRRYLMCLFTPDVLKGLPDDEVKELKVSSALFMGGSLLLMLILIFGFGASPLFVVIFYLIVMTMIIALIRAVAEGGVLGMQSSASVFSIMKTVFGMNSAWCAPVLAAPLILFNTVLFGGFRALIAPMMANALKVREEFRIKRLHFHGAIWAAIFAATFIALITLIMISYSRGADNLHGWLNSGVPKSSFAAVRGWVEDVSAVKSSERWWLATGAILMGALLFGRQRVFGIPHPIGLLMLMNPNMFGYWGSILIGWGCKSVVSKYCNRDQYISIRRFFIGLVIGHLTAVLFGWDPLKFHWG